MINVFVFVYLDNILIFSLLSQKNKSDYRLHPCAFFSRRFTPTQRNYDIGNRELLALEEWRPWLEGAKYLFLIWTNHRILNHIRVDKRLSSRQARWALFFNRFNLILSYHPGSKNLKPDALSRQFEQPERESCPEPILPTSEVVAPFQWNIETAVKRAQQQQPDPNNGPIGHLFVPNHMHYEVLQWAHASLPSGQPGTTRSSKLVQRKFL